MKLLERSFSGKLFRPRPEIYFSDGGNLLLIATPWGPRGHGQNVIETISSYYLATCEDLEITSPYERLSCLSTIANNLRIAVLLANGWLSREQNKSEYSAGVEIFAAALKDHEFVWLQVGSPQVLLFRPTRGVVPLGCPIDLSFDLSERDRMELPPLPSQLLGLDSTVNLTMNSFRPLPGDKLILISRSFIPADVYNLTKDQITLDQISRILSHDDPDVPFWLGVYDLL